MDSIQRRQTGFAKNRFGSFNAYLGTLITAVILAIGAAVLRETGQLNMSRVFVGMAIVFMAISSILALIMLYRIWEFVIEQYRKYNMQPSIRSAGRAVGFLFIPIFNLFWIFKSYGALPAHLNTLLRHKGIDKHIPHGMGYLVSGLILIGIIPGSGWLNSVINTFILIPVFLNWLHRYCLQLYAFRNEAPKDEIPDRNGFTNIDTLRNLPALFRKPHRFNIHLVLFLVLATLIAPFLQQLLFNLNSFSLYNLMRDFGRLINSGVLIAAASIILLQLAFRISEKTWAALLLFGAFNSGIMLLHHLGMIVFVKINAPDLALPQFKLYIPAVLSFLWGIIFLGILIVGVKQTGITWWGFILIFVLTSLLSKFFHPMMNWLFIGSELNLPSFSGILTHLPYPIMQGIAWYLGIRFHFRSGPPQGTSQ